MVSEHQWKSFSRLPQISVRLDDRDIAVNMTYIARDSVAFGVTQDSLSLAPVRLVLSSSHRDS